MIRQFHDPFAVLLVRHPAAGELAVTLVRALDAWLTAHDPDHPLAAGSNLPTYTFHSPPDLAALAATPLARRLAVVLVADDPLAADPAWRAWAAALFAGTHPQVLTLLCALTPEATTLPAPPELHLDLTEAAGTADGLVGEALVRVTTHLLRALPGPPGVSRETPLLVSHDVRSARAVSLARSLVDRLRPRAIAERHFTELAPTPRTGSADPFRGAAVIILHTDDYSANPWCQHDVLHAKRHHCPALVIDLRLGGETRQFPHLGNLRVLCRTAADTFAAADADAILAHTLREFVFDRHTALLLDALRDVTYIPDAVTYTRPPEFATLAELAATRRSGATSELVIYPDPPLVRGESELLRRYLDVEFLSLTQAIATTSETTAASLTGRRIALSIADSPDLAEHGLTPRHIERAWISLARHLLDAGATLDYGGDLRPADPSGGPHEPPHFLDYGDDLRPADPSGDPHEPPRLLNYSIVLADLLRAYADADPERSLLTRVIRLHLAWPAYHEHQTVREPPTQDDLAGLAAILRERHEFAAGVAPILCPPPKDIDPTAALDTLAGSYTLARSLTALRQQMAVQTSARVLLGGKHTSTGIWPGLAEEAIEHLRHRKPIYLIGAYGGMTRVLIDILERRLNPILTDAFQFPAGSLRHERREHFNAHAPSHVPRVDLSALSHELATIGTAGLDNGLTPEENRRLYTTRSLFEQVALVLHGLRNLTPGDSPA